MKKLFIFQPMNGKTGKEIWKEKEGAIKKIHEKYPNDIIGVINSFIAEDVPEKVNAGLWYLGKSLELLATADCAYFAEGWQDYRVCRIEHECAVQYGIEIVGE